MSSEDMLHYHVSRHWSGPGPLEEDCPCPKEPCGFVAGDRADWECDQHHWRFAKSMRSGHSPENCPGPKGS